MKSKQCHIINSSDGKAVEKIMKLTNNRGLDTAIEVVGVVATFELCEAIVAAGVHLVTIGVHGKSVTLQMEKIWSHNITITTRLVDTVTTPIIIKTVQAKKINLKN